MAHHHDHDHDHDHPGLDVQVERTGPCVATVKFTVTPEEFQRSRQTGLKNLARRTRLKGFRPGKVPPAMLEKHYGEQVDRDLTQHFLQEAMQKAVRDNELRPAASPRVTLEEIQVSRDEPWGHEFELLLRPEIELGQVEGLEVEERALTVTDADVDAALADVRRQLSRPEPAGEDGLPEDGMAVCKVAFLGTEVGEPLLEREGIRLGPGAPPPGVEPDAFKQALTGARVGQELELPATYGDDFPVEDARGQTGTCRITVSEAFRIVEPTEEQLFAEFGVEDDAALRTEVRSRMERGRRQEEDRRIEKELLEKIIEAHPMELPQRLVDEQAEAKVDEMRTQLEPEGLEQAELDARLEEERKRAHAAAAHAMRAIYLMEEIARTKDLMVTEKDLMEEFAAIAARNQVELEQVRKYYQEEHLLQQLGLELLERKVRGFLRESANISPVDASE